MAEDVAVPCHEYLPSCNAACCHLPVQGLWDPERRACRHLTAELGCAIYADRPAVCRGFDCRTNPMTRAQIVPLRLRA
jgi:Fe-S-cluster containining protein